MSSIIHREKDIRPYFMKLVENAAKNHHLNITEMSRFYIVNLLYNFIKTESVFDFKEGHYEETPLAIMLAKAIDADSPTKIRILKKMGDISLYISGYFSEHIDRKMIDVEYYISMGESAYKNLSSIFRSEETFHDLYNELSGKFVEFMEILSDVRSSEEISTNTELLRMYERWLYSDDPRIKERLEKEGFVLKKANSSKKH